MDSFFAFWFLVAAVWFFIWLVNGTRNAPRRSPLEQVARRYGGRIDRGTWLRKSSVQFLYIDTPVRVRYGTRRDGAFCEAELRWSDGAFRLSIASAARGFPRSLVRGLARLDSAGDVFFGRYRVFTNQPAQAAKLLSDGFKWQVEQLRSSLGQKDIELHWSGGHIVARKYFWPRDGAQLEQFTSLVLKLYDQAMMVRAEGIEFIPPADAQPVEDVNCQVCGEHITTDMVFCRRCRTPHHRECWEYTGVCSVFGCRETQYAAPRVKSGD